MALAPLTSFRVVVEPPAVVPAFRPMSNGVVSVKCTDIVVVWSLLVVPPDPPSTPSEPKFKAAVLLITQSAWIVTLTAKFDVVVVATAGPPTNANPATIPSPVIILILGSPILI